MLYHTYIENCEKSLTVFENIQAQMLYLDLDNAGNAFRILIINMTRLLKQISTELEKYSFKSNKDKVLITKQIERLQVFLKEMDLHIQGFYTNPPPNENELIFIFERQHLFKNIFRKHLSDISAITS